MRATFLFLSFTAMIFLMSCGPSRQYTSADIATKNIRTIAVLPVEMEFTGTLPQNMTMEMKQQVEEAESKGFQQVLYSNLLRYEGRKNKMGTVQFQSIEKTISILNQNNISYRDAWSKDPDELSKLLGVDGVIKMKVVKKRFMSDLASMGLGIVKDILFFNTNASPTIYTGVSNKTGDLYATCSMIHAGNDVWNARYDGETNWNSSAQDVMNRITRKMAKGFPL